MIRFLQGRTFREKISISLTLCTPPQKLSPRLREINRVKKNGFISVEILFQNALHECICHHIVHYSPVGVGFTNKQVVKQILYFFVWASGLI